METVHQLDDDGDLRLLDVITAAVGSVRLSSRTMRISGTVSLLSIASIFSGVGLANTHRANEVAESRIELLQILSGKPQPSLVWTSSATQGLSCLELKKSINPARAQTKLSSSTDPTVSLKLYCYPSRLLDGNA